VRRLGGSTRFSCCVILDGWVFLLRVIALKSRRVITIIRRHAYCIDARYLNDYRVGVTTLMASLLYNLSLGLNRTLAQALEHGLFILIASFWRRLSSEAIFRRKS